MDVTAAPLAELRRRTSAKWRIYPDDVLPLFVAEMDFPLAPPVAEALHDVVRRSDTGYAVADSSLFDAFSGFASRRLGWEVDPDQVRTTADVSMGVVEVLRRVTKPGDGVIITPPVYPPFFALLPEASVKAVSVPLRDDGTSWRLDLDGIDAAFARGARALLLCNPHNPLGHPHSADELKALAEIAAKHGAVVVSDEIHGPLTHSDGSYVPYLSVSDAAREHGVAVTSASKAFNLAGTKCALMVTASDTMRPVITEMYDEVYWRTSILGVHASTAAFRDGDEWLDAVLRRIEQNRQLLAERLAELLPEAGYREPRASYLAWLDLRATGLGNDPASTILRRGRVALNRGLDFGPEGAGHARLNFGCSPEVLSEAIERIIRATLPSS